MINNYGNDNVVFSDELQDNLNNTQFYAQPKNTELKLHFENSIPVTIGNAVVMNIEYTDEKIPVYSYNSDLYEKFLKGKSVITGVIALRKTTVDKIIALLKNRQDRGKNILEEERIKEEMEIVMAFINKEDIQGQEIHTFYKEKLEELKERFERLETKGQISKIEYGSIDSNIKADLLYYNAFTNSNNSKITISYKDEFIEEVDTITNILFTKKQTNINIGRNDIIEMYHFIGNPSKEIS